MTALKKGTAALTDIMAEVEAMRPAEIIEDASDAIADVSAAMDALSMGK
jgi:hypothetical protein